MPDSDSLYKFDRKMSRSEGSSPSASISFPCPRQVLREKRTSSTSSSTKTKPVHSNAEAQIVGKIIATEEKLVRIWRSWKPEDMADLDGKRLMHYIICPSGGFGGQEKELLHGQFHLVKPTEHLKDRREIKVGSNSP